MVLEEVFKSIVASGPLAALLLYIWILERKERREVAKQKDDLVERILTGLNASTSALEGFQDFIKKALEK